MQWPYYPDEETIMPLYYDPYTGIASRNKPTLAGEEKIIDTLVENASFEKHRKFYHSDIPWKWWQWQRWLRRKPRQKHWDNWISHIEVEYKGRKAVHNLVVPEEQNEPHFWRWIEDRQRNELKRFLKDHVRKEMSKND